MRGLFTSIGGLTRNHIARLDPTTGLADSFNPNAGGDVYSMAIQADGKILAAGAGLRARDPEFWVRQDDQERAIFRLHMNRLADVENTARRFLGDDSRLLDQLDIRPRAAITDRRFLLKILAPELETEIDRRRLQFQRDLLPGMQGRAADARAPGESLLRLGRHKGLN